MIDKVLTFCQQYKPIFVIKILSVICPWPTNHYQYVVISDWWIDNSIDILIKANHMISILSLQFLEFLSNPLGIKK